MECRPTRHPLTVIDRSVAHPTTGTLAHVERNTQPREGRCSDGDRRPAQIPVRFADHGEKGRPADREYGQRGPKLDAGMTLRAAGQCGKATRGEGHLSGPCTCSNPVTMAPMLESSSSGEPCNDSRTVSKMVPPLRT